MKTNRKARTAIIVWITFFSSAICDFGSSWAGPPRESWSFDKLFNESDLIVLGRIKHVEYVGQSATLPDHFRRYRTTIDVSSVIKGEAGNSVSILHDAKIPREQWVTEIGYGNGPLVIDWGSDNNLYESQSKTTSTGSNVFMFFLKMRNGELKPVSGDFYAVFSVFEVRGRVDSYARQPAKVKQLAEEKPSDFDNGE